MTAKTRKRKGTPLKTPPDSKQPTLDSIFSPAQTPTSKGNHPIK